MARNVERVPVRGTDVPVELTTSGAGQSGVHEAPGSVTGKEGYESVEEKKTYERERVGRGGSPTMDALNEFYRSELSAVETYDLALKKIHSAELATSLRNLRDSHDKRAMLLRQKIEAWGGVPSKSSGAWGAFAKIVQRGADLFGDRAALASLEEGEDRGLKMYEKEFDDLDAVTRSFVTTELLPEQRNTHAMCRSLERFAKAS